MRSVTEQAGVHVQDALEGLTHAVGVLMDMGRQGDVIYLPKMSTQIIAARTVAVARDLAVRLLLLFLLLLWNVLSQHQ